ncbi:MAG: alkaline phosphatase [Betaproteobacteria bacterium]|nr:alkaline phosphatase [Betaproteobacteria bacterium]
MTSSSRTRFNVDEFVTLNRRKLLRGIGASALLTATGGWFTRELWAQPVFSEHPFSLGVASGDPAPDGFVLWTKIAPKPLERGGGMPNKAVEVAWAVATDEAMTNIVQHGKAIAAPALGHSVHVEIAGLEPARDYFYRFTVGGQQSRVGRTRTFPRAGAAVAQMKFAVAGCQRYEAGYFNAYRKLAEERFDFVFHYGDYIYEYATLRPDAMTAWPIVRLMPGESGECVTLEHYRQRYAIYQLNEELQAAHASAPFIMSFDDHEVVNDWAGEDTLKNTPRAQFLLRRAAAFQAWYEHLPLRRAQMPKGPNIQAYRRLMAGDLLALNVLDTRQYRTGIVCGARVMAGCEPALEPNRTMLGEAQERWLYESFKSPAARWTLLAQQIPLMRQDRDADPNILSLSMDKWDGAVAARERLFGAVEQSKLANLVVVDGDVHENCAGELKKNFDDEKSATLGVDFTATSISSGGDGFDISKRRRALMQQDPHIKFYNNQRGYVRHVVTPKQWRADYQVLDKVSVREATMRTRRSFVVESGAARLNDA